MLEAEDAGDAELWLLVDDDFPLDIEPGGDGLRYRDGLF